MPDLSASPVDSALSVLTAGGQPPPGGMMAAPASSAALQASPVDPALSILTAPSAGTITPPAGQFTPNLRGSPLSGAPSAPQGWLGWLGSGAAAMGKRLEDSLTAGVQSVSPNDVDMAQLAPDKDQWTFRESGSVPNEQTQVALRNPQTGDYSVYVRNPNMGESMGRLGSLGRQFMLATPESGIPAVAGAARMPTASQALMADYNSLGIPGSIPAVGQGIGSSLTANIINKLPIVGAPVARAAQRATAGTAAAADRLAGAYGNAGNAEEGGAALQAGIGQGLQRLSSGTVAGTGAPAIADRLSGIVGNAGTPEEAGSALQAGIGQAAQKFKADAGRFYDQVGSMIAGNTPVSIDNTLAALRGPMDRFPSNPALGSAITNPRLKQFYDLLTQPPKPAAQPSTIGAQIAGAMPPSKPQDIINFLLSKGGVQDQGGELSAMDMDRVGPGYFGRLARSNGMPLDQAREAAAEAGYLHPDSDINDLLNAVYNTTHGSPVFNPSDPAVAEWTNYQNAQRQPEQDIPFFDEPPSPTIAATAQKMAQAQPMSFGELSEFRSYIGRMLGEPALLNDIPRADLKTVYGGISQDLGNAAQKAGPQASAAFNQANNFYRTGIDRMDQLEPLLNKSPEQSFAAINRAAGTGPAADMGLLRTAQGSLPPQQWSGMGPAILRNLEQGSGGFAANWNKLSDAAKDSLFGANTAGSAREGLESLARIGGSPSQIEQVEPLLNRSPEQAFAAVNRAAGTGPAANAGLLQTLQSSLTPGQWGNVGAAVIRKLGQASPGAVAEPLQGTAGGGGFSAASFLTNWNKLSDAAKDTLFGANTAGSTREGLEALASVAGSQKQLARFANPSGSGTHVLGGMLAEHFGDFASHPIQTVLGLVGGRAAASALMSPTFARWLYQLPATVAQAPRPIIAMQQSIARLQQMGRLDPRLAPAAAQLNAAAGSGQPAPSASFP